MIFHSEILEMDRYLKKILKKLTVHSVVASYYRPTSDAPELINQFTVRFKESSIKFVMRVDSESSNWNWFQTVDGGIEEIIGKRIENVVVSKGETEECLESIQANRDSYDRSVTIGFTWGLSYVFYWRNISDGDYDGHFNVYFEDTLCEE